MENDLFNQSLLRKYSKEFKPTYRQKELVLEYVQQIENGLFKGETTNYLKFYDIILKDLLGYSLENVGFVMKDDECTLKLLIPDDEKVLEVFRYGFVCKTPLRRYLCHECEKHFTDLTGTIFSNKRIPIGESFYIITQLDKKSIKRLSEELGHKWGAINQLAKNFKECLKNNTKDPTLTGEVEMDEMYIHAGSKSIKKKNHKDGDEVHIRQTKPPIITMVERDSGYTIFSVQKNLSIQLIRHKIRKHCENGVTIYTDEYPIYNGLKKLLKVEAHKTITHSENLYAKEEVHVNNCENRHSLLRPFLNMYQGVSKRNLNNYVKFFQFIFNNGINWFSQH